MTPSSRTARAVSPELQFPLDRKSGCSTCRDAATPMRVLEVDEPRELALCVDQQECRQTVDTGIVGAVVPGDTLLVHAGTALVRERA